MTHTRHHPHTWELIRDDYLAGQTRAVLAERYGVGESTIRDRAAREGWRRVDQLPAAPALPEAEIDELVEFEPMRSHVAVIADAYRFADLFMRRGRPAEAQRYLAIARGFERLNRSDPLARAVRAHWAEQEQWHLDIPLPADQPDELDPPNPPNPPSVSEAPPAERTEDAPLPPAPRSEEQRPVAEQVAELEALIARRRANRLPFHDVAAQISRLTAINPSDADAAPQPAPALLTRPCHDPRHR